MRAYLIAILLVLLMTASWFSAVASDAKKAPISIVLEPVKGRKVYKLESKVVPLQKLLDNLYPVIVARGSDAPVVVLVHQSTSIADLKNLRGILEKAGFSKIRYFSFSDAKERMAEIIMAREAVEFSLSP